MTDTPLKDDALNAGNEITGNKATVQNKDPKPQNQPQAVEATRPDHEVYAGAHNFFLRC